MQLIWSVFLCVHVLFVMYESLEKGFFPELMMLFKCDFVHVSEVCPRGPMCFRRMVFNLSAPVKLLFL